MSVLLEGLEGVVCQIADALVYAKDQTEHKEANITLHHVVNFQGVSANLENTTATSISQL